MAAAPQSLIEPDARYPAVTIHGRRLESSLSQGDKWKALINPYIATIPVSGDPPRAAEQSKSGMPPPSTAVSSAMIAKVGAAARDSNVAGLMMSFIVSSRAEPSRLICLALSKGGLSGVGDFDPPGGGGRLRLVVVMPVPPLVWRRLRVTLGGILPDLLSAERGQVEVAPDRPHRLVGAVVDEIGAKHAVLVADEHVVAVPFADAEIGVEAIGDAIPRHLPAHPRLQPRDVFQRRARDIGEGRVSGVEVGEMGDLIGAERTAAAGLVRPTEHPGLEEGAVDDELPAALEEIDEARFAVRPLELVSLLDGRPRHPPAFGRERIA